MFEYEMPNYYLGSQEWDISLIPRVGHVFETTSRSRFLDLRGKMSLTQKLGTGNSHKWMFVKLTHFTKCHMWDVKCLCCSLGHAELKQHAPPVPVTVSIIDQRSNKSQNVYLFCAQVFSAVVYVEYFATATDFPHFFSKISFQVRRHGKYRQEWNV